MQTLHVKVRAYDIKKGKRLESRACPIAHSLRSMFGEDYAIFVTCNSVIFRRKYTAPYDGPPVHVSLPDCAKRFVFRFDSFGDSMVKPFSFTLEVPDRVKIPNKFERWFNTTVNRLIGA